MASRIRQKMESGFAVYRCDIEDCGNPHTQLKTTQLVFEVVHDVEGGRTRTVCCGCLGNMDKARYEPRRRKKHQQMEEHCTWRRRAHAQDLVLRVRRTLRMSGTRAVIGQSCGRCIVCWLSSELTTLNTNTMLARTITILILGRRML